MLYQSDNMCRVQAQTGRKERIMSVVCLVGFIYAVKDGISLDNEYFIIWALFAIADALWMGAARK